MFDRDSLWNYIHFALEREWPDAHKSKIKGATERICEEVSDWVPKKGDFWLNEDDGVLYVNKGWEVVCAEAPEPVNIAKEGIEKYGKALETLRELEAVSEEENDRRFKEALNLIKGITHEQLVDLMGEDWLEEFRKVAQ